MGMFNSVKVIFSSEQMYDLWTDKIRAIGESISSGVRYDPRGYDCVYLNLDDEGSAQAVKLAEDLGARVES